jgi:multifunctional methyltransferase subunit TRM112
MCFLWSRASTDLSSFVHCTFVANLHTRVASQGASELGIPTLPAVLTEELAQDNDFLIALYHILMNVHLVQGVLTCPDTGREFPVTNEIPNMILEEEECERVRY